VLRQAQQRQEREDAKQTPVVAEKLIKKITNHQPVSLQVSQTLRNIVKHYPSIDIVALKAEQALIYWVWLLCRHLDVQGQGWLEIQDLREQQTNTKSKFRLFSYCLNLGFSCHCY